MIAPMAKTLPDKPTGWSSQAMGALTGSDENISEEMLNQEAVMLLYGSNMFGDRVYSYVKFTLKSFMTMRQAMVKGESFNPSEYGTVIAAGRGEPTVALKDEMRVQYGLVDAPKPEKEREPEGFNKPALFDENDGF